MKKYQVEILDDSGDRVDSMIFFADHKAHAIEQYLDALPIHENTRCLVIQITEL